jgi:hypothetical protein
MLRAGERLRQTRIAAVGFQVDNLASTGSMGGRMAKSGYGHP